MKNKTEVLTVRVTAEFKHALRELAADCRRSQANYLECLVLERWHDRMMTPRRKAAVRHSIGTRRHGSQS